MKFLLSIIAVCLFAGCNPVKKVLKDKAAFDQIGKTWAQEHPCVNDTVETFLPGRIDSIPYPVLILDKETLRHKADSITRELAKKYHHDQQECDSAVNESFNIGFQQATYLASLIKVPVYRPDTLKRTVTDTRERDLLRDDKVVLVTKVIDYKSSIEKSNHQKITAYVVAGLAMLFNILLLIILFKKK